jgi:hypothetical protein
MRLGYGQEETMILLWVLETRGQITIKSVGKILVIKRGVNSRNNASNGNENPDHGFIPNGTTRCDPTQSHNGTCLYVTNHSAGYGASLGDDEEL